MPRNELLVGDPAPAFPPAEFIKGTAFSAFEPGYVYVVECWATWCGPCVSTIPHLTQMQKDHPDARFVGVAVWERKGIEDVRAFVAEKGDAMGYAVAFDAQEPSGSGGWMPHHWLNPAYQEGIPTAFIVDRQGRIAWIGHPAEMDKVLPSVMDGTFDMQAATARYATWMRRNMTRERSALQAAVRRCLKADDHPGALRALEAAFADCPGLEPEAGLKKLRLLLREDSAGALTYGRHLVTAFGPDHPPIKRQTALEIIEALNDDTGLPLRQALARFVIDTVQQLEAEKPAGEDAYEICIRAHCLAVAFLVEDHPSDALRQAELALDRGRAANLPETVITRLRSLADRCASAVATRQPQPPTVVCDGDVCRIS